jgi:hypothetical protein
MLSWYVGGGGGGGGGPFYLYFFYLALMFFKLRVCWTGTEQNNETKFG